jgi:hypothetical protein
MNLMNCMLSGLFVLTALLLTFFSLSAEWLLELYTPTDPFGNCISLLESQRQGEQLSHETQLVVERIHLKDAAVEKLLRGEMTLIEAAAWFRSLHDDTRTWRHPFYPRPEHDDGESWCREVINWAETKMHAEHWASHADAMRQRLEAELQEQLECYGTVILPD